jgi:hypothetical protein
MISPRNLTPEQRRSLPSGAVVSFKTIIALSERVGTVDVNLSGVLVLYDGARVHLDDYCTLVSVPKPTNTAYLDGKGVATTIPLQDSPPAVPRGPAKGHKGMKGVSTKDHKLWLQAVLDVLDHMEKGVSKQEACARVSRQPEYASLGVGVHTYSHWATKFRKEGKVTRSFMGGSNTRKARAKGKEPEPEEARPSPVDASWTSTEAGTAPLSDPMTAEAEQEAKSEAMADDVAAAYLQRDLAILARDKATALVAEAIKVRDTIRAELAKAEGHKAELRTDVAKLQDDLAREVKERAAAEQNVANIDREYAAVLAQLVCVTRQRDEAKVDLCAKRPAPVAEETLAELVKRGEHKARELLMAMAIVSASDEAKQNLQRMLGALDQKKAIPEK